MAGSKRLSLATQLAIQLTVADSIFTSPVVKPTLGPRILNQRKPFRFEATEVYLHDVLGCNRNTALPTWNVVPKANHTRE